MSNLSISPVPRSASVLVPGRPAALTRPIAGLATAIAAVILLLGTLGSLWLAHHDHLAALPLEPFDLDGEYNVPATWSFLLLLAAGVSGWRWTAGTTGRDRLLRRANAAFFCFMSLDELLSFHERAEAWTGVDWQTLYVPVVLVGAVGWLHCLRRLDSRCGSAGSPESAPGSSRRSSRTSSDTGTSSSTPG